MSDDPINVWREALKDSNHPRHSAAWVLFTEGMTSEKAEKLLRPKQETVLPWLLEIVETEPLYQQGSLGNGHAPAVAVGVLGRWKVTEILPRLIAELEDDEEGGTVFWEEAIEALRAIGEPAIEPLLELAERTDPGQREITLSVLADIAKGNDRALALTLETLDHMKNEWDIRYVAESLLVLDPVRGIEALEARIKARKFDKKVRGVLEGYIKDTRAGKFHGGTIPPEFIDMLMPPDDLL